MTANQLSQAMKIAQDKNFHFIDENGKHLVDTSIFDGFGLYGFQPIVCTLEQLAALIRWQCFCMNGSIDSHNLNEIMTCGRHKFTVIGAD